MKKTDDFVIKTAGSLIGLACLAVSAGLAQPALVAEAPALASKPAPPFGKPQPVLVAEAPALASKPAPPFGKPQPALVAEARALASKPAPPIGKPQPVLNWEEPTLASAQPPAIKGSAPELKVEEPTLASAQPPAIKGSAPELKVEEPTLASAQTHSIGGQPPVHPVHPVQPVQSLQSLSRSQIALTSQPGAATKLNKKVSRGNPPSSSWLPPEGGAPVRAALLCIHGLGLHNETYAPFGKRMAQLGVATYALDMRGFGSYRQAKGHEEVDFDGCLDDLYRSLRSIRRAQPGKPVFLLGESMGGAIALHAMALRPDLIDGLITSVPAGDRYKQASTSLKVALQFIKGRNKEFNVGEGVVNQATDDPELRAAWLNDPLARMNLTPMELLQFQQFMNQNHEYSKQINSKPVLVVFGCRDKLVKPEGSEELFKELTTADKEIYPVTTAEHLIFEENQFNPEVIERVDGWLNTRINAYANGTKSDYAVARSAKPDSL